MTGNRLTTVICVALAYSSVLCVLGCSGHIKPNVTMPEPGLYAARRPFMSENEKIMVEVAGIRRATGGVLIDCVLHGESVSTHEALAVAKRLSSTWPTPLIELEDYSGAVIELMSIQGPYSYGGTISWSLPHPERLDDKALLVVAGLQTEHPLKPGRYEVKFLPAWHDDFIASDYATPVTFEPQGVEIK